MSGTPTAPAPEPLAWAVMPIIGNGPAMNATHRKAEADSWREHGGNVVPLYAHPAPAPALRRNLHVSPDADDGYTDYAAPAPETVAWMIVEPGCEYGPTFATENAAWSALTKAPPGSELVELIRRKA